MEDPFASLRAKFLARCRSDAERLRALAQSDPATIDVVHRLSGSAGTFGYAELSKGAEALEDALRDGRPARNEWARLLELLDGVQED